MFFPSREKLKSQPHNTGEITFLYILISVFTDRLISCPFRNYWFQIIAVCMLYVLMEERR